MRPDVRAVLVVDAGGALVGVVTPRLARRAGRRRRARSEVDAGSADVADAAVLVLDADLALDDGYRLLEEAEVERAPVVERGRLVGVLSRSVVQRRLAEDETPAEVEDSGA